MQQSAGDATHATGTPQPDAPRPAGQAVPAFDPGSFDPAACEREAIHLPGAIQPHGALLAARGSDGRVTHVSANIADYLGRPPEALLGQPLRAVIGLTARGALNQLQAEGRAIELLARPPAARPLRLRAHRIGGHVCLDIEVPDQRLPPLPPVQPVLERFRNAADIRELCDIAVQGLRALGGYDRVMAYRFGDQGHGEVFAEAHDPGLESILGLRYPAADIPPQARRQYLRQSLGLIADSAYRPVPLIALGRGRTKAPAGPLDLTYSSLRSVSPMHREYMRNMGVAASMTIALALGETSPPAGPGVQPEAGRAVDRPQDARPGTHLWGLLVCHHRQPRLPDFETRLAAELIGKVLSVLLAGFQAVETDRERQRRRPILQALLRGLTAAGPLSEALAAVGEPLLAIAGATGAVVRIAGKAVPIGATPPLAVTERALDLLQARGTGPVVATESLGTLADDLAPFAGTACGAMLVRFGQGAKEGAKEGSEDAVLWLRPEQALTVTWGGNPAEHGSIDPASGRPSPRRSFQAWKEVVRGSALRWSAVDQSMAQEVGQALDAELAQRVRPELALVQEASRAKSRFMAGMSHELRTPLNGILGHARLLAMDGGLGPLQSRRVDAMLSAGMHLLQIIGGVLELSEIEADRVVFEPESFDPRAVAAECLDVVRPMAEAKRLSLRLEIAADVPPLIVTDPTRFRQIQLNLLGNAVKFTREGGVALRLRLAADHGMLQAEVVDSGPGIDPRSRHRLFQAFQRLGAAADPGGSAGLGLAITARLVALLGGSLGHKDNPGGGSIFWLEIPLMQPAPPRPGAAPDRPRPLADAPGPGPAVSAGPPIRILVADDSAINRDVAQGFLQAAGHSVAFAEDGVEAVAQATAADFDLILMDIRMPRMDGLEATRRIRALPGPRGRLPIVALTAQAFSEQVTECRHATMDGYLTKPFTMEGLLAAIAAGLAARQPAAGPSGP